jgi:TonB family protein
MKAPLRGLLPLLALLGVAGCADTVQPYLGGLKVGVTGGSYQMPVLLNETLPFQYPPDAWRQRVGGETVLYIHINSEGAVDSVMVLEGSGHASLDSAALAGARKLRFRPAQIGTDPVDTWGKLPIRFPMPEATEY